MISIFVAKQDLYKKNLHKTLLNLQNSCIGLATLKTNNNWKVTEMVRKKKNKKKGKRWCSNIMTYRGERATSPT